MAKRTLIAYQSKNGAAAKTARIVAEVLRTEFGHEVEVVDLKENKNPDLSGFDNVVIGSGIRIGMWYGRARGMMKRDFTGKKLAVYVCAMRAEGKPEDVVKAWNDYLQKRIDRWMKRVRPVAQAAFGGWYKSEDDPNDNNHDPDKVRAWAAELGRRLAAPADGNPVAWSAS
ncbi:hypothetical protein JXB37_01450 [candidate division WOR-3 bacterium]|nr:hypothetical protein [candidate division WOR-3 bacterium]